MARSGAQTLEEATFAIGGMTCASCAAIIEKVVGKVDGVESANVNLATEKLKVAYDACSTSPDSIVAKVESAGFSAAEIPLPGAAPTRAGAETVDDAGPAHAEAGATSDGSSARERRLFAVALALSIPVLLVSMVPPFMMIVPTAVAEWLAFVAGGTWDPMMIGKYAAFALATPVQFVAGAQFYRGFWHALKRRTGNMDTLIAIGTSAAFLYSVAATFVPALAIEPVFYETSRSSSRSSCSASCSRPARKAGRPTRSGRSWVWLQRPPASSGAAARWTVPGPAGRGRGHGGCPARREGPGRRRRRRRALVRGRVDADR